MRMTRSRGVFIPNYARSHAKACQRDLRQVAVSAECAEEFARAVEELAVERFGGATFSELIDCDEDDKSMVASARKSFDDQVCRVPAAAERVMRNCR